MDINSIKGFIFDLDGVFYISNQLIPGAIETLDFLNEKNIPYKFVTNTTTKSRNKLYHNLKYIGLNIEEEDIISACYAGVLKLREFGNPSIKLLLQEDAKPEFNEFIIDEINPEYIIVGDLDTDWNFELMNSTFKMVMNGSRILALHKGHYFQTDSGLQIDSGAFIKAIEYATSTESIVVGKPTMEFFNLALKDIKIKRANIAMIGDDLINDIQGAQLSGLKAILTKTGKYDQNIVKSSLINPDLIIDSIAKLAHLIQ